MNQRMQAPPPGPRPSGIGLICIGAGTFSETATGRERAKAAAAMKRHPVRIPGRAGARHGRTVRTPDSALVLPSDWSSGGCGGARLRRADGGDRQPNGAMRRLPLLRVLLMKAKRSQRRRCWQDAFRERFREFCRERGIPAQQTEAGLRAARSNAKRNARRAKGSAA